MKYLFIIFFCLFTIPSVLAQDNQTQILLKLKSLQEKKIEFHKRTNGETDGYRLKIHFSADRSKAREVKSKFDSKYTDMVTYEDYQQPNFVIMVGDYKTKLEAYEALKKIREDYPYAFIVKSKVRPMKLN